MKVFNAILGVFSLFGAFYAMMAPARTFLTTGWIVTVLLCLWGVCALFEVFRQKGDRDKLTVGRAILALVAGVASAVVSILMLCYPGLSLPVDIIAVWIFTGWLLVSGISSIAVSVKVGKPAGGKRWIFTMIMGILTVAVGAYGVFHVLAMAQTIGILIGVMLMVYGVRLLASVFE